MDSSVPLEVSTPTVVSPSKKSIIKTTEKILSSDNPLVYIEKAGIDLLAIYKGLGNIALHADIMAKDRDGDTFVLGADNRSRIMASTLILELAKHIKDKNVIVAQGIFNDPKLVAQAQENSDRVLELKNRMKK